MRCSLGPEHGAIYGDEMTNSAARSGALALADPFSPSAQDSGINGDGPDALERAISTAHRGPRAGNTLGRDQKAAIIVRLLLSGQENLPLDGLKPENSAQLVRAMADLSYVNEATILSVIQEFLGELGSLGLYFRPGIDGALETLSNVIDDSVKSMFVELPLWSPPLDPWEDVAGLAPDRLAEILAAEIPQVCAIVLAKLKPVHAAEVLAALDSDHAHAVALATATIEQVPDQTIADIGTAISDIAAQTEAAGPFQGAATDRISEILNFIPAATREDLLAGLERANPDMTEKIRRTMFTFGDIPERIDVKDVPAIVRAVDNDTLISALAGGRVSEKETVEFILANLSKRLAEQLADEIAEVGEVIQKDADAAMNKMLEGIRSLADSGGLSLITPSD